MGYFNELPNLDYLSQLPDANSNETYITVKNLFKRAKLRTGSHENAGKTWLKLAVTT